MEKTTIEVSLKNADILWNLKRELRHRSLNQTISYILYELEKKENEST